MNSINTNGWDTVYSVPFSMLNSAIASNKSSPASFSVIGEDDNGPIDFHGDFGDWQLIPGGDGQQLMMTLPIPTAHLKSGEFTSTFKNISAEILLNLKWVDDPEDANYQNLKLNNDRNTVFVSSINYSGTAPVNDGVIRQYLHGWLVDNVARFNFVFGKININYVAAQESFAWMAPTDKAYAVKDASTPHESTSLFGILCMTGKRPAPGSAEVPAEAIPAGANSSFLIAPERLIEHVFFPRVQDNFKNAANADFRIDPNYLSIKNIVKVQLPDQQLEDGSVKEVFLEPGNFSLSLQADKVILDMTDLYFKYNDNFTVHFNHNSPATLSFPKGVFNLAVTGSNTNTTVETSPGYFSAEIAASVAGIVVTSVIGGFVGGLIDGALAARAAAAATIAENGAANIAMNVIAPGANAAGVGINVAGPVVANAAAPVGPIQNIFAAVWGRAAGTIIGGIVGAVVGGGIPLTMELLKNLADDHIPTLADFGKSMLAPVLWPTAAGATFEVVNGTLDGALQVGIILK